MNSIPKSPRRVLSNLAISLIATILPISAFGAPAVDDQKEFDYYAFEKSMIGPATTAERRSIIRQLKAINDFAQDPTRMKLDVITGISQAELMPTGCHAVNGGLTSCGYYNPALKPVATMTVTSLDTLSKKLESDRGASATWNIDIKKICITNSAIRSVIHGERKLPNPPVMYDIFPGTKPINKPSVHYNYFNINKKYSELYLAISSKGNCIDNVELHFELKY
ncbi:hypothetical protein ACFOLJ_29130 [Rugamonas sp. CCM 8940]|uniref:hypothetical protein n=1 Tax=Rugamonas sp. CCM 8940 TaxID=2765359 RepID=UPI0018F643F8|nr:hypothetical protein [Rugamonas sp. CCM 8940]MBJ7312898.1 hypothetical protein [Rugamonas sp. CCM 8940]